MAQARRDAGTKLPLVAHRRNHSEWLVTMPASAFFEILTEHGHNDPGGGGGMALSLH
jgi:hypothetical protein